MNPSVSILLVDDEAKNLLALESILEREDYRLVRAQSADEALLALMKEEFAAIVLDVQMPDMSGIDLAKLIKQRKKTQHVPILFLTAYYQEEEHVALGYDVGAVDYLTKPVDPATLRSKVAVFVDLFRKTAALAGMNQAMAAEIAEREKVEGALRAANAELEAKNVELEERAEERIRRIRAEAARERSALLAEASNVLAASFDYEKTFDALARLIVPKLADGFMADVVEEDGEVRPAIVVHHDPECEARIREYRLRHPARIPGATGVAAAVSGSGPLICPDFNAVEMAAFARSADEFEELRQLAIQSYLVVPLRARGRSLGALCFLSTRSRRFSEADAELAEELAQRAGLALDNARLYQEAQHARDAAEAANAAKDRFLAMLSHELRTPLSPVLHSVVLLEGEPGLPASVRDALGMIRRNVQLEARLIDDLLDLARIRNGKLQLYPEPVDAHDLLRRALEICEQDISTRGLATTLELCTGHARIHADPARIQQIFWNLITNAIKFTPEGGLLTVSTRVDAEAGHFRFEIADTGTGIPPARLEKIFDAFEQAENSRSTGLGLGLAICKVLTTLHGGSIEARSEGLGSGSVFRVSLPLAASTPRPAENLPSPATAPDPLPLRVLLVEDHADTAETLRRLLVRRGYHVQSADSVAAALRAAEEYEFDVLLSDIGLPDGTGVDLMRQLVSPSRDRHFRGIALSGYGMHEDLERSKAVGFSEHLTKPVDFPLLHATLVRIGQELASEKNAAPTSRATQLAL